APERHHDDAGSQQAAVAPRHVVTTVVIVVVVVGLFALGAAIGCVDNTVMIAVAGGGRGPGQAVLWEGYGPPSRGDDTTKQEGTNKHVHEDKPGPHAPPRRPCEPAAPARKCG